jgi:hypothetical protein
MSPLSITSAVLVIIFGAALAGMLLRAMLPDDHLNDESREVVKLAMALVGTMTALILGLLITSAKGFYDTQSAELTQASANIILLDRVLAHYGPEAHGVRDTLRGTVVRLLEDTWPAEHHSSSQFGASSAGGEALYDKIQALSPQTDLQRSLQAQALNMTVNLGQTRWLMFEQGVGSVPRPMVAAMVFWLTFIFISWGLFAPRNLTAIAALFTAALSVSGAIFLILEMYSPYNGLIQVSSAPLRAALAHLGQ